MAQFLYDLIQSPSFYYVLAIWLIISFASLTKRRLLFSRLLELTSKPVIFSEDLEAESIPFYPRKIFERIANAIQKAMSLFFSDIVKNLQSFIKNLINQLREHEKPWKPLGYGLFAILFFFLIYANAISITITLDTLGLINSAPPEFLARYGIVTFAGSIISLFIGIFTSGQIYSNKSEYSDWDKAESYRKNFGKLLSQFLIISGFLVVISLSLQRLESISLAANPNEALSSFTNFILSVVVPLNLVIAMVLIAEDAFKGIYLLLIASIFLLLFMVSLIFSLLGYLLPFTFDIVYRLILFVAFIFIYIFITPLDSMVSILSSPFSISDKDDSSKYD